jgi:hypothetical protein
MITATLFKQAFIAEVEHVYHSPFLSISNINDVLLNNDGHFLCFSSLKAQVLLQKLCTLVRFVLRE